jgi:hypothetical protein
MLIIIQKRIDKCFTEYEMILINIIELLSERGLDSYSNSFYENFEQSNLITKIKKLINE